MSDNGLAQPLYFSRDTCEQAWIQRTGILYTQDAGRTWTIQSRLPLDFIYSISFTADGDSGWAFGVSSRANPDGEVVSERTMLGTGDGGVFWNRQRILSGNEYLIVAAVSPTQAVAAGARSDLSDRRQGNRVGGYGYALQRLLSEKLREPGTFLFSGCLAWMASIPRRLPV